MMPTADLTDATVARLQRIAIPLQDTYDTVISRLLDEFEANQKAPIKQAGEPIGMSGDRAVFDPANPPPLAFTTPQMMTVDGKTLPKGETFWNRLAVNLLQLAAKRGHDAEAIYKMLVINGAVGEKTGNGYFFVPEAGVSIQGQDSNGAFRQSYALAKALGVQVAIDFYWQANEKAVRPSERGRFEF